MRVLGLTKSYKLYIIPNYTKKIKMCIRVIDYVVFIRFLGFCFLGHSYKWLYVLLFDLSSGSLKVSGC